MEAVSLEQLVGDARGLAEQTLVSLRRKLVALDGVIAQVLMAVLAGGHVLLEGVPGTAKTTLCRDLATVLGLDHSRIQFTPDLLPSDVTGTKVLDQRTSDFRLQKGPIFCRFLLADELNRAPARTQSALLEAMQERQVTIEGDTLPLPAPFIVLATQNPVEQEGVYRLPEAQLDRFLFRVQVGYPDRANEIGLLESQESPEAEITAIWDPRQILQFQPRVDEIHAVRELKEYVVDLARATRDHPDMLLGASPRAALFLMRAARARAFLNGRTFCSHEDVQAVCQSVLAHRLIMRPEAELAGRQVFDVITEIVRSLPIRGA